jgi:hypothetical protein
MDYERLQKMGDSFGKNVGDVIHGLIEEMKNGTYSSEDLQFCLIELLEEIRLTEYSSEEE